MSVKYIAFVHGLRRGTTGSRLALFSRKSSPLPGLSALQHALRSRSYSLLAAKAVEETESIHGNLPHVLDHADGSVEAAVSAHSSPEVEETPAASQPVKWTHFEDRLDPIILQTLKTTFRYDTMTSVQEAIISKMPIKTDLLVRSKTGTGKTLAFLIPALQRALLNFEKLGLEGIALKKYANKNASVLIISPTRELANQIATELRRLVSVKGSNMRALCLVGGDSKRDQLKLIRRERNDFIVGTPGRMLDMLTNDPEFSDLLPGVHTLILDEADTLLEMNFKTELDALVEALPKTRQTYMFSATVSREIQKIVRRYLRPDHEFINTVGEHESDVHPHVNQKYIIRSAAEHLRVVLSLIITRQLKDPNSKVIVFLPTTKMTMLYATVFRTLRRLYPNPAFQQFDIHSNRSQDSRTKVAKSFREAQGGSVLFTSDVSARGVDYPGISLVIQVGSPQSRDLYVHRVGRTGRAGKGGEGVLLLQPFERDFLRTLGKDIPITEQEFPDSEIALGSAQEKVFSLMRRLLPPELLRETFFASGGAYLPRSSEFRVSKEEMVDDMGSWWQSFAGDEPAPTFGPFLMGSRSSSRSRSTGYGGQREQSSYRGSSFTSREPSRNSDRGSYSRGGTDRGRSKDFRPARPSERTFQSGNRSSRGR